MKVSTLLRPPIDYEDRNMENEKQAISLEYFSGDCIVNIAVPILLKYANICGLTQNRGCKLKNTDIITIKETEFSNK